MCTRACVYTRICVLHVYVSFHITLLAIISIIFMLLLVLSHSLIAIIVSTASGVFCSVRRPFIWNGALSKHHKSIRPLLKYEACVTIICLLVYMKNAITTGVENHTISIADSYSHTLRTVDVSCSHVHSYSMYFPIIYQVLMSSAFVSTGPVCWKRISLIGRLIM